MVIRPEFAMRFARLFGASSTICESKSLSSGAIRPRFLQTGGASIAKSPTSFTGPLTAIRSFSSTAPVRDLMEFFDVKKNWGVKEVRSGRSWTTDDLRLKSNPDLHKLWYVLYKERNMLYTMKAEYKRITELFPNPERIDKVEESMENLEAVVNERNKAVKLLEVGVTGEAPQRVCYSGIGLRYTYTYQEHLMPYWRNAKHFKRRYFQEFTYGVVRDFRLKLWEKNRKARNKLRREQTAKIHAARREFPDHPIWQQGLEPNELTLRDLYHGKMSD